MAIRLIDQYPNRAGVPNADYPHGVPRNKSTPTATDGTPFEQSWFRDQEGFFQGLLETAGITPSGVPDTVQNSDYLNALFIAISQQSQFSEYNDTRTYTTGDVVRGSDGVFYEFYDRDQDGTTQGTDPTNPANRPHIWMEWDGVKPGSTIEWRSETLPEGYVENDGAEISRTDYRRIFSAFGTAYGSGDGIATFLLPDDRGEFKRGLDKGRGVDAGRALASHQDGTIVIGDNNETPAVFSAKNSIDLRKDSGDGMSMSVVQTNNANDVVETTISGNPYLGVSRPRNNAVIYLTKI